jgi:hypothetical protein
LCHVFLAVLLFPKSPTENSSGFLGERITDGSDGVVCGEIDQSGVRLLK